MDERRLQQIEQDIVRLRATPANTMQLRMFCGELIEEVRRLKEFEPGPYVYLTPAERDKLQQEKNAICRNMVDRFTSPPEK